MYEVRSECDGEWQTTSVRALLASWDLAVDFTARTVVTRIGFGWDESLIVITPQFALDPKGVKLADEDLAAVLGGLTMMSNRIPVAAGPWAIVVQLRELKLTPTDYQPEAAMIAAAHWLAQALDLEQPEFEVIFDEETHRYLVTAKG